MNSGPAQQVGVFVCLEPRHTSVRRNVFFGLLHIAINSCSVCFWKFGLRLSAFDSACCLNKSAVQRSKMLLLVL